MQDSNLKTEVWISRSDQSLAVHKSQEFKILVIYGIRIFQNSKKLDFE